MKRFILLLSLSLVIVSCISFIPTKSVFAASRPTHAAVLTSSIQASPQNACGGDAVAGTKVYDSYGHYEGDLGLYDLCPNGAIEASFWSNTNTWKTVFVYVEYSWKPGYQETNSGFIPNHVFWTPAYYDTTQCYYAEVDLIDNRGVNNWVGTGNWTLDPNKVECGVGHN